MTSGSNDTRATAALVVNAVRGGQNLDIALASRTGDRADRAMVFELCYGTLRHCFSLQKTVDGLLQKPLKHKDQDIYSLLLIGAYQKYHMRVPLYAAIDRTVEAAADLAKPWAKGLLNAVLRRLPDVPITATELPEWLAGTIARAYPDKYDELLRANQTRAPMALRVNRRRGSVSAYRQRLVGGARPGLSADALILDQPIATSELPGFADGDVAVQDDGAQLAAGLLDPAPGARVLDACAAPGGKAFHLVERSTRIDLTALEIDAERCDHLSAEARRLGHAGEITIRQGDATTLNWWDQRPFDAVLLDAPCTGTGTLRRHPDIKLHRSRQNLDDLTKLQRQILANLWRTLRPGGTLLYCTCSILPEENQALVTDFLGRTPDAALRTIDVPWGYRAGIGRQLLPTEGGPDGFFFVLLDKALKPPLTQALARGGDHDL